MLITFGSVGDIISICILVKDIVDCLSNANGAPTGYQVAIRELWSLERVLLEVHLLPISPEKLPQINSIKFAAQQCRRPLEDFQKKIRKLQYSRGGCASGNILKDGLHRIQWAVTHKKYLQDFRTEVTGHTSVLNMWLLTAGL